MMASKGAKNISGRVPDWVMGVLERRRDWLVARAAIKDSKGEPVWCDDMEANAIRLVLKELRTLTPENQTILELEAANKTLREMLTSQQQKLERDREVRRDLTGRIDKLKRALAVAVRCCVP
jgi:hypothetical protein